MPSPAEIARCDEVALLNLTPDCARWLATGHCAIDRRTSSALGRKLPQARFPKQTLPHASQVEKSSRETGSTATHFR